MRVSVCMLYSRIRASEKRGAGREVHFYQENVNHELWCVHKWGEDEEEEESTSEGNVSWVARYTSQEKEKNVAVTDWPRHWSTFVKRLSTKWAWDKHWWSERERERERVQPWRFITNKTLPKLWKVPQLVFCDDYCKSHVLCWHMQLSGKCWLSKQPAKCRVRCNLLRPLLIRLFETHSCRRQWISICCAQLSLRQSCVSIYLCRCLLNRQRTSKLVSSVSLPVSGICIH